LKPNKALPELLEAIRANVLKAYKLLQTQNATDLSKVMAELGMQNFSVSYYVAEYEFEAKTLEAEHKRQVSVTFMQEREEGATEKNADAKARQKWADMYTQYLIANKSYRLAKSTHGDVTSLLDIMRSRIGILRQELERNK
jgi:hypothetical protein